MQDLDSLLKQQDQIEDDGFTVKVVEQASQHLSYRKRVSILFSAVLVGSILSFCIFFLSQGDSVTLTALINSAVKYQTEGMAFVLTITMVYLGILFAAEDLS